MLGVADPAPRAALFFSCLPAARGAGPPCRTFLCDAASLWGVGLVAFSPPLAGLGRLRRSPVPLPGAPVVCACPKTVPPAPSPCIPHARLGNPLRWAANPHRGERFRAPTPGGHTETVGRSYRDSPTFPFIRGSRCTSQRGSTSLSCHPPLTIGRCSVGRRDRFPGGTLPGTHGSLRDPPSSRNIGFVTPCRHVRP